MTIVQKQMELGQTGRLALLSAQQAALQTRLVLSEAQAARFADTAALFQALGGGWWHEAARQTSEQVQWTCESDECAARSGGP